ncbi:Metallo-dependent phosphatase-like protein [Podospora fimiseda]|uniref:Metallo-dependent phosphatase-like protein n=1 Tax=Podospora fimiseda TaxID=252190 RepID=A0AAN7BP02_9PEZI|nr:Metallo-dependent phosphatase-like protein [Podospora fimiseda]
MDAPSVAIPQPMTRRTRIVCINVLIHAGDLTNKGSYSELSKAIQWLERLDFERKIVIAGNHDLTLDQQFYSAHGQTIHNQGPQDAEKCLSLLKSSRTITYLCHGSATIRLSDPKEPKTEFTVFRSPYTPRVGLWGFSYERGGKPLPETKVSSGPEREQTAEELWASIPLDADILVTHTPPYGHCDASLGCEELRAKLALVRPRLHICGHVHHGRGAERVKWDFGQDRPDVEKWTDPNPDPSSAKISLIDLTARGGNHPLDFHHQTARTHVQKEPGDFEEDESARTEPDVEPADNQPLKTTGASPRDRQGRRETCVINCAIVANSWPHTGGKRYNKPIVVDLDLPVWR